MQAIDSLLLRLSGPLPLHEQIYTGLRERILNGDLPRGARLPSSRQLSTQLGVARSTVLQALDALQAEGYLIARAASSTRVAPELPEELQRPKTAAAAKSVRPPRLSSAARALAALPQGAPRLGATPRAFRPGVPALDLFPAALWSRLVARQSTRASAGLLSGSEPAGSPALREAIALHVSAARGVRCSTEQVFITAGTQQAFEQTASLLLDPGDTAWLEEPGYLGARAALVAAGARVVPVPVDERGIDVNAGIARAPDAKLIMLTPSHQYPLGITTSLARRLQLLAFAAKARAVIVEDDYDSEFRHRGRPLMALQGLDESSCVVYIGTFSKTMFPGLRLGFLIAPDSLVPAFARARSMLPGPASAIDQAALARFIADGHFATHLRRMRSVYRERCDALLAALQADCK
ncbi:MAG TPA: PLP-dependent aminotransferase family protein, partial [Myxococcales bacterium]|nr:PLP-dependent aminotransferase family protein [Myxococcales bacterium]